MHELLLTYGFLLLCVVSVSELLLTILLYADYARKKDPVVILMAIIGTVLCFNSAVLAAGAHIMIPVLVLLSRLRLILRGLVLPLTLAVCAYGAPFYKRARHLTWVLTVVMMLTGGAVGLLCELDIVTHNEGFYNAITRYMPVELTARMPETVPTALAIGIAVPLVLTGIFITFKHKSPTILLSGICMLGCYLLAPVIGCGDLSFLFAMIGELFMLLFFLIFEKRHISVMYDYSDLTFGAIH